MPDPNINATSLVGLLASGTRYATVRMFVNEPAITAATALSDFEFSQLTPPSLEDKLRFGEPEIHSGGTATLVSQEFLLTRAAGQNMGEQLRGYAIIVKLPLLGTEFLLAARKFDQPIVLPEVGKSVGVAFSFTGLRDPATETVGLTIDVQHRIVRGRGSVHGTLRHQLRRLQDVLSRILKQEGKDTERVDRHGGVFTPFLPDAAGDEAARVVLDRCRVLLDD